MKFRSSFPALLVTVLAWLLGCAAALGQAASDRFKGITPADPEGVLHQLAPDDAPPRSPALKPAERTRAIRLLVAVKRDETGWHRQLAIYLLAALGHDYERNLDELLRVWRRDTSETRPHWRRRGPCAGVPPRAAPDPAPGKTS